ncbi:MAG TPA: prepilin-type N-terminal cleavage/methylation domain-containing protein [Bryobacteraceae bacterium]
MRARRQSGFTLLEVLVATTIMGLAVVGLVSLLSGTLRNAARLTDYDRATILAKRKMDELLVERLIPRFVPVQGVWNEQATGSIPVAWKAMVRPFDVPPGFGPGTAVLDRVELTVYWHDGAERERTFTLEGFRRGVLGPADADAMKAGAGANP